MLNFVLSIGNLTFFCIQMFAESFFNNLEIRYETKTQNRTRDKEKYEWYNMTCVGVF